MSNKKRVDRIKLVVSDEETRAPEMSIDVPTFFKIDTSSLYDAVMKELCKQENNFKKLERKSQ